VIKLGNIKTPNDTARSKFRESITNFQTCAWGNGGGKNAQKIAKREIFGGRKSSMKVREIEKIPINNFLTIN